MSKPAVCPACWMYNLSTADKHGVAYYDCLGCKTIYADYDTVNQLAQTHNDGTVSRNHLDKNLERIDTVSKFTTLTTVLDFGCGGGELVKVLNAKGLQAYGMDKHLNTSFWDLPELSAAFMVEVIEHLSYPRTVLFDIAWKLKHGGILYIESTFSDQLRPDWISHPYVDPRIGHCTILSQAAVETLAKAAGFKIEAWLNANVLILRKDTQ